jgi:hypothetical protein
MANIESVLNYAHENRKFIGLRLIAPIFVASLFLVVFLYSLVWQGAAKPPGVTEMRPHQTTGSAATFPKNGFQ